MCYKIESNSLGCCHNRYEIVPHYILEYIRNIKCSVDKKYRKREREILMTFISQGYRKKLKISPLMKIKKAIRNNQFCLGHLGLENGKYSS